MWKRFNHDKDRQIGNPVLIETTYDEKRLDRIPTISDMPGPGGSPSGIVGTLSPQGVNLLSPPEDNRISVAPTASSIYSQPSPEYNPNWRHQSTTSSRYSTADVSPPISPVTASGFPQDPVEQDVSPIEEPRSPFGFNPARSKQQASHIPLPKKAAIDSGALAAATRGTGTGLTRDGTKWDEYTGERTNSERGKSGQVKPSNTFTPRSRLQLKRQDYANRGTAQGDVEPSKSLTLAERAARFGGKALSIETNPRPEWKGASGRAPLIQPVKDKPSKQVFSIRKADKTLSPVISENSGHSTPTPSATANIADTRDVSVYQTQYREAEREIKPTVPLKAGLNSPKGPVGSTPSAMRPAGHAYPSPKSPGNRYEAPTNTVPNGSASSRTGPSAEHIDGPAPPRTSNETSHSSQATKEDRNAVTSRFSWTTYATNTTYQQSPPPSPPPPLPTTTFAPSPVPVPTPTGSIIARRRPVPSGLTNSMPQTARKPVPRPVSPTSTVRTNLSSSTFKALPRPPPEMESVDLISNLQAQLDDLEVRRNNIRRLIRDLSRVETLNPMVSDLAMRRESQRKVREFETELAEIGNMEHDIGLRLHRAYKRRERDASDEHTTLWIRRVTG